MTNKPVTVIREFVSTATVGAANAVVSDIRIKLGGGSRRVLAMDVKMGQPTKMLARTVIGVASFHFDNKAKHPFHYAVTDHPLSIQKRKTYPVPMDEPVSDGCIIDGYFQDSGVLPGAAYPYNITIRVTAEMEVE